MFIVLVLPILLTSCGGGAGAGINCTGTMVYSGNTDSPNCIIDSDQAVYLPEGMHTFNFESLIITPGKKLWFVREEPQGRPRRAFGLLNGASPIQGTAPRTVSHHPQYAVAGAGGTTRQD